MMQINQDEMIKWMDNTFTVYASDSEKKKKLMVNYLGVFQVMKDGEVLMEDSTLYKAIAYYESL